MSNSGGLGTFIWEATKWEEPALFDGKGEHETRD